MFYKHHSSYEIILLTTCSQTFILIKTSNHLEFDVDIMKSENLIDADMP